ncbi:hypothetical protein DENSPDRAFT_843250 [Dentipellis sp. KUC8613]|nr:hypothetical protein DENSPDRAFT_843250 [Dentipellis sp. KUC8613]
MSDVDTVDFEYDRDITDLFQQQESSYTSELIPEDPGPSNQDAKIAKSLIEGVLPLLADPFPPPSIYCTTTSLIRTSQSRPPHPVPGSRTTHRTAALRLGSALSTGVPRDSQARAAQAAAGRAAPPRARGGARSGVHGRRSAGQPRPDGRTGGAPLGDAERCAARVAQAAQAPRGAQAL